MADINASLVRSAIRNHIHQACRADLHTFSRLALPVIAPGEPFEEAHHFRVLATALEKVVRGETQRLLIAIPPRHGKSIFCLGGSALLDPGTGSIGQDHLRLLRRPAGERFSVKSRDILRSSAYRGVFPGTELEPGGAALDELRTTRKGYRLATSVGGVVTGKGADYVIVDDPIKAVDAASVVTRNSAYDWYKTSLLSRFDKPGEGRQIVTMQRLHMDDLIGRLRDDGGFTVLEMPGEAVERQVFDLGHGEQWEFRPGDLLYPERFPAKALDRLKSDLGEAGYNAQILQRPVPPGGALLQLKHFQRYSQMPSIAELVVQSWDPAFVDSETAAYTVCTTWAIYGRKAYLLDVLRQKLKYPSLEPTILHMKEKHKATFVFLETAGFGKAIGNQLIQLPGYASGWFRPIRKWARRSGPPPSHRCWNASASTFRRRHHGSRPSKPKLPSSRSQSMPIRSILMVHFLTALLTRNHVTRDLTAFKDWPDNPF